MNESIWVAVAIIISYVAHKGLRNNKHVIKDPHKFNRSIFQDTLIISLFIRKYNLILLQIYL